MSAPHKQSSNHPPLNVSQRPLPQKPPGASATSSNTNTTPIRPAVPKRQQAEMFLNRQLEVKLWIESVLEAEIPNTNISKGELNFQKALQDGVALCKLMRKIKPESIPVISENPKLGLKMKENIHFFINAVEEHVARHKLFSVTDLYENQNFFKVIECMEGLAMLAIQSCWTDKEIHSLSQAPKWSEETLKRAEKDLMFTEFKPRIPSVTRVRRDSSGVRKSMAMANPQVIQKEIQKATQTAQPNKKEKIESGVTQFQAYVRGLLARRKFEKRIAYQAYRKRVVEEILETETVYVSNLGILVKYFVKPIKEGAKTGKNIILKLEEIKIIFPDSIEVILNYNTKLLQDLQPRINKWQPWSVLGDIFLEFCDFMKVYTQYVKDFPNAQSLLDKLKVKGKFKDFLQEAKQNPDTRQHDLDAFLILPIQRIPRYNLLLADLLKHTWTDHQDYKKLQSAYEKMQEVASYINERKRESDNINKILEIESRLKGLTETLADPKRRFVREGNLSCIYHAEGKEVKERFFFLFNDRLVIAKPSSSVLPVNKGSNKEVLKVQDTQDIVKITLHEDPNSAPSFLLCDTNSNIIIRVSCSSKEERDSWLSDFNKCRDELNKSQQRAHEIAMKRAQDKAEQAKTSLMESYRSYKEKSTTVDATSRQRLRAYTESKKGDSFGKYSPQLTNDSVRNSYDRSDSKRNSTDSLTSSEPLKTSRSNSVVEGLNADQSTDQIPAETPKQKEPVKERPSLDEGQKKYVSTSMKLKTGDEETKPMHSRNKSLDEDDAEKQKKKSRSWSKLAKNSMQNLLSSLQKNK